MKDIEDALSVNEKELMEYYGYKGSIGKTRIKFKILRSWILHCLAYSSVHSGFAVCMQRARGVKIGKNCHICPYVQIDLVYPKKKPSSKEEVQQMCEAWLEAQVRNLKQDDDHNEANTIESMFEKLGKDTDEDEDENEYNNKYVKTYADKKATIVDILCDKKFEREGKLNELNISLNSKFPKLEGDKCTFIGSTFMNYGNADPHFNHCIVLNSCSPMPIENSVVESYATEREIGRAHV